MVGVDIGHSSVKLVYAKNGEVKGYGLCSLPPNTVADGRVIDPVAFVERLSETVEKLKAKGQTASVSLPLSHLFFRKISLPIMEEEEVEEALGRSISEYVSSSPEDIYWDFHVSGINPSDERYMDVILVVSKKEQVDYVVTLLAAAGLDTVVVEGHPFSCFNALEPLLKGVAKFALLDVGFYSTKFFVYEGAYPVVSREFPTEAFIKEEDELRWAKEIVAQVLKISKTAFTNPISEEVEKGFIIGGCISDILLEGLREVLEVEFTVPKLSDVEKPNIYLVSYGASKRELEL